MRKWVCLWGLSLLWVSSAWTAKAPWIPLGTGQERVQVKVLEEDASHMILELEVPTVIGSFIDENGQTFIDLKTPNCGWITEVGAPQLPLVARLFALPGNSGATVRISETETQELRLPAPILPYQGPTYRNGQRKYPTFQFRSDLYQADSYPSEVVRIGEVSIVRDVRIAPLIFYPIVYHPRTQAVTVYTRIRVEVRFEGIGPNPKAKPTQSVTRSYRQIWKSLLLNYNSIVRPMWTTDGCILVITHDDFLPAAQAYAEYKRSLGYDVVVTPLSSLGTNPSAYQIKAYIQEAYDQWPIPPEYIVLVGDAEYVPYFSTSLVDPTDHPYTELEGDDYLPDVHLARISVQTLEEANYVIVHKTLGYEQNPPTETTEWFQSGTGISGSDYVDDQNAARCGQLAHDFGGFTHWDSLYQSLGTNTVSNLMNALNEGRSWIAYFGHGYETGWASVNPSFTNSHIYQLQNGMKLPVIVDIACSNGDFTYSTDCFAEAWIKAGTPGDEKGAINIVASTIPCAFFYTDTLGRGTFIGYFQDSIWSFGAAVDFGKLYMYQYFPEGPGGTTEETIQNHEVFNDPHMDPWSAPPKVLTVSHPVTVPLGPSTVSVTVSETRGPVPEALVAIFQDTVLLGKAYTDASGQALIPINVTSPESLIVRVSYHNAYPYEGTIHPVSNEPYVALLAMDFTDENGNGEVNENETITLNLWVKNFGSQPANGVTGVLETADPWVELQDTLEVVGDLGPGDSLWLPQAFSLHVLPAIPDEYWIPLTFRFISSTGDTWTSYAHLQSQAPVLNLSEFSVVDTTGSPVIDPGEPAWVIVRWQNRGHSLASGITLTLQTEDTLVTLVDTFSTLPYLAPDSISVPDTFLLWVSPNAPIHSEVHLTVTATTGSYAFTDSISFLIGIGGDFLVWDPDPTPSSGPLIRDVLQNQGLVGDYVTDLSTVLDILPYYHAIFVCVGIYPNNVHIAAGSPEASALESYLLDHGGNLYLEGGDVWYWDPQYSGGYDFGPLFGINATEDGSGDLSLIVGESGTFTEGMTFTYSGENNWIDHLEATGNGAFAIFHNAAPSYTCAVANVSENPSPYRTVGTSFELGGLVGTTSSVEDLILQIAAFFGLETGVKETEGWTGPPRILALSPPTPNPAHGQVIVRLSVPQKMPIDLSVFDITGRKVRTLAHGLYEPGVYVIQWNGRDTQGRLLASGLYFLQLHANSQRKIQKVTWLRSP